MDEAEFWTKRLRPTLMSWFPGIKLERIENGVANGTPDVFYCHKGRCGWIENKFRAAAPKRSSSIVLGKDGLRTDQKAWWREYLAAGGRGGIAVGVGTTTWLFPATVWLVKNINDWDWQEFTSHAPLTATGIGVLLQ